MSKCDWNVDGMWCKFPGAHSNSTLGGGPFFCRFHARCDGIHEGREIVMRSQTYAPERYEEMYVAGTYPKGDTEAAAAIRTNLRPNPPAGLKLRRVGPQ